MTPVQAGQQAETSGLGPPFYVVMKAGEVCLHQCISLVKYNVMDAVPELPGAVPGGQRRTTVH